MPERISGIAMPIVFFALAVVVWGIGTAAFHVPEYLFPGPGSVVQSIARDYQYYLYHGLVTLAEALAGFGLAVLAGLVGGTLLGLSQAAERILLPYAVAFQAVPIVAVAPLLALWLGPGTGPKVAMAALLCVFPMIINTTKGLRSVRREQLALFQIYDAGPLEVFAKLRLPSSIPFLVSGMRISAALSMIGAIVAEYAGADRGIGYVIMQSTYRLDTVQLFAGILFAACGGLIIFSLVLLVERFWLSRFQV